MDELDTLRTELEHYRNEKERIRDVIGQIGGKSRKKHNKIVNIVFLVLVIGFFVFDVLRHVLSLQWDFLPPSLLLEITVLLVSVKIVWMIHTQGKIDHFQFWVLNSIEFQLNMISRRIGAIEPGLGTKQQTPAENSSKQPAASGAGKPEK